MLISVFTHFPLCLDRGHFGVFVTWSLWKKRNKRMCVIYDIWPKSNSFSFYLMRVPVQFKKKLSLPLISSTSLLRFSMWHVETTPRHGQCTILLKTFSEIWEVMCWLKQAINKLWAVCLTWSLVKKYPVSAALFLSFIVRSRRKQNTKESHS